MEHYLKEVSAGLDYETDAINTNHVIVNAILNTKYKEMKEKNIIFVFKINDLSELKIADEDIVVILSNLLNNAIEACEKYEGRRVIKLKFTIENGDTIISVKNTYNNDLIMQDYELMTTKDNRTEHGIGIKNIITVIEKYGGSYVIEPNEGEFYFSVMM